MRRLVLLVTRLTAKRDREWLSYFGSFGDDLTMDDDPPLLAA